jgi:cytochrome c peroxidase
LVVPAVTSRRFLPGRENRADISLSFPFHDGRLSNDIDSDDPGRHAVTGRESDRHKYKVPTLRNVALTAPYFHHGAVPSLSQAVRVMALAQLNV